MTKRSIKFRSWDKKQKRMFDWVWVKDHTFRYFEEYQQDQVLLEYTGLKDKNGKEIYEGDIVDYILDDEHFTMVVEFVFQDNLTGYDLTEDNELLIIGNIYENPDLIK